jgi:hypothetical protein
MGMRCWVVSNNSDVTTLWLTGLGVMLCLPESAGLDLHAHHGEDAAHIVRWDGPVLVGEPIEATLQHQHLEKGKTTRC